MNVTIVTGSNHKEATSTKLSKEIGRQLQEKGWAVQLFDLYEKPLPLYNPEEDYSGVSHLAELKEAMAASDAVVLATPEYHGSMSGVLKNALDHLGFEHFDSKAVLSVSSSGGAIGVSSLSHLQTVIRNLHGINCPEWISIGGEAREFLPDGKLRDPRTQGRIERVIAYFARFTEQTKGLRG